MSEPEDQELWGGARGYGVGARGYGVGARGYGSHEILLSALGLFRFSILDSQSQSQSQSQSLDKNIISNTHDPVHIILTLVCMSGPPGGDSRSGARRRRSGWLRSIRSSSSDRPMAIPSTVASAVAARRSVLSFFEKDARVAQSG